MARINSFRDLDVYQLVRSECRRVMEMTRSFPKDERYSLIDQIRRSSRSVMGHIAESWGRRAYPNAFAYRLDEAIGEANETQAWLDAALDAGYVDEAQFASANQAWQHIGGMLNRMIQRKDDFCNPRPNQG